MRYVLISIRLLAKQKRAFIVLVLETVFSILMLLGLIGKLQTVVNTMFINDSVIKTNSFYLYAYPYVMAENKMPEEFYRKVDEVEGSKGVGVISDLPAYAGQKVYSCILYNDTIIGNIELPLKEGEWFLSETDSEDSIPLIYIGDNFEVGDTVDISFGSKSNRVRKTRIIGTMPLNSHIISFANGGSVNNSSFGDMSYKVRQELFIAPESCLDQSELVMRMEQNGKLMFFEPNVSDDEVYKAFQDYGAVTSVARLESLHWEEVRVFMIRNGIVFLIFALLTVFGIGGQNGVQYIKNKRQFAIYYMLGMTSKQCACIEAIRAFLLLGLSWGGSAVVLRIKAVRYTLLSDDVTADGYTFAIVAAYIILIYMITSVFFIRKILKSNPIESYRNID
jgi:hypothetical protein